MSDNSLYTRVFGQDNKNWQRKNEYNKMFLAAQNGYLADLLQARGHVFLNEVYDMLGFSRTSAGAVVGWFKEPGSNPLQFHTTTDEEGNITIEFNPDGLIYHKLEGPTISDVGSGEIVKNVEIMKRNGYSEFDIATVLGLTTTGLRAVLANARQANRTTLTEKVRADQQAGYSNAELAEKHALSENDVRAMLRDD